MPLATFIDASRARCRARLAAASLSIGLLFAGPSLTGCAPSEVRTKADCYEAFEFVHMSKSFLRSLRLSLDADRRTDIADVVFGYEMFRRARFRRLERAQRVAKEILYYQLHNEQVFTGVESLAADEKCRKAIRDAGVEPMFVQSVQAIGDLKKELAQEFPGPSAAEASWAR